ncbi:2-succinyl-5-enolpyruvyl-6-hydroxy-3-cyclohexene-1-carboxylic-acid synthase [Hymenobacter busanensis]|uniref:2-succinyl-5-enolpyruvyl-6-hydroxy-3-cyclohexene-1-carboxylate synthase n=1 Tax=Hymenobacter busanensis TaxID=2607656 RepID=A0A7L5A2I4_9BACT|nr:2-succinyl-5-enolpyruvyl-6-hydroxy-3-cyclohexene-1-carboxylic-acid synthase [Hymenobacter busanensis]KAA9327066.1 2-succinyl-5-enolpyruvyl-6-hydroxy-3-cyclohexene-1-carboxylic-acid synthase [Hymenobacter busanensis]QHJ09517.1 2-succinyl-5-enolpyruvyl-6-hydroxy-3-cyclohexene-1-carboxylic-acid synthase [Hymenobacter busanensis]
MSPLQPVHNIAEICARHGITDVVLSPGSRCAPLTIAFARHPEVRTRVVPDERAAAFIALGLAQAQRRAVALVCTSGTAGLNYAPAVAEAYFQQVPLVLFTADRPPEWIDQLDGQTIRQTDLYGGHAKGAFEFPADLTHPDARWHAARMVSEAINLAQQFPAGPVQVNVPLREPFYPAVGEEIRYDKVNITQETGGSPQLTANELDELRQQLRQTARALVVAGQHPADAPLLLALRKLAAAYQIPVVGDLIANVHLPVGPDYDLRHAPLGRQDVFMAVPEAGLKEALRPELLITFGQSLISKALKNYLREYAPTQHWHVQPAGAVADTFKSLTRVIRMEPAAFFEALLSETPAAAKGQKQAAKNQQTRLVWQGTGSARDEAAAPKDAFATPWQRANGWATEFVAEFMQQPEQPFNEFSAIYRALQLVPDGAALHLANSMAVRYANILGVPAGRAIEVFANRGTSGIDGCTSTAVGAALAQPGRPVVLLTGDVAFFYDRNALWHNYPVPNLRIILINNHAGGIFRLIDGPRQQPELEEFFETHQPLTAENTARDFNLRYRAVRTFEELDKALPAFFAPSSKGSAALLEITTDSAANAAFFEHYRTAVRTSFS